MSTADREGPAREHTGRVVHYDRARREVLVKLGGPACRVCGGAGCALKDRVVRAAVAEDLSVAEGDQVCVKGDRRAMVRAVSRLVLVPAGAAALGYSVAGTVVAASAAVVALAFAVVRGSRRADLPRLVPDPRLVTTEAVLPENPR